MRDEDPPGRPGGQGTGTEETEIGFANQVGRGAVPVLHPQAELEIQHFVPLADREFGHLGDFMVSQQEVNLTGEFHLEADNLLQKSVRHTTLIPRVQRATVECLLQDQVPSGIRRKCGNTFDRGVVAPVSMQVPGDHDFRDTVIIEIEKRPLTKGIGLVDQSCLFAQFQDFFNCFKRNNHGSWNGEQLIGRAASSADTPSHAERRSHLYFGVRGRNPHSLGIRLYDG